MVNNPATRRLFLPGTDEDLMKALKEYLSSPQVEEFIRSLEMVKSQTGFGAVAVVFENGHPRFVETTMSAPLDKVD